MTTPTTTLILTALKKDTEEQEYLTEKLNAVKERIASYNEALIILENERIADTQL